MDIINYLFEVSLKVLALLAVWFGFGLLFIIASNVYRTWREDRFDPPPPGS